MNIIKIRRVEVDYLRESGFGWAVICGHGTYKNYFLVTEKNALKELEDFRTDIRNNNN